MTADRARSTVAAALLLAVLLLLPAAAAPQLLPAAPAEEPEGPAPGSVAADAGPAEDAAIERRLEAIFATAGDLEDVTVEVESGVVRLGGEALRVDDAARAVRLARSLSGVVDVVDGITVVRDVRRRLAPAVETLREGADALVGLLPLLAVAAALVALFALLARWVGRWDWLYERLTRNPFARDWLRRGARGVVILAGVVLALELLGATALVGAVLGAAGLAGLAVGFAFRDTVENYIAGVLLSLRQPFAPNDLVEIEGREGKVVRLTPRATVLMTLDGNHVRIPNAIVFKGIMVNYTRNPRRRFRVEVGIGTDVDLAAALDLGTATLERLDGVLAEPPPWAWIERLGDSSVAIVVVGWVDQRTHDFGKVRSEGIRAVKEAFDAAGFDMPEPIYRVHLRGTLPSAEPAAEPGEPAAEPAEKRPRPTPALPLEQAAAAAGPQRDTSPDVVIDREVAADRAAAPGEDLLDPAAPKE